MTNNPTIDGVSRERVKAIAREMDRLGYGHHESHAESILRALLDAPVVERQPVETVPKHKFDTLVQHCKRIEGDIAQARAHVNEITLYQQNAVWFWQHDGEDFLASLSCPIIIQPHHLRELLEGRAQHNPMTAPPELAALQSTIAQLQARVAELESGRGEQKLWPR